MDNQDEFVLNIEPNIDPFVIAFYSKTIIWIEISFIFFFLFLTLSWTYYHDPFMHFVMHFFFLSVINQKDYLGNGFSTFDFSQHLIVGHFN